MWSALNFIYLKHHSLDTIAGNRSMDKVNGIVCLFYVDLFYAHCKIKVQPGGSVMALCHTTYSFHKPITGVASSVDSPN